MNTFTKTEEDVPEWWLERLSKMDDTNADTDPEVNVMQGLRYSRKPTSAYTRVTPGIEYFDKDTTPNYLMFFEMNDWLDERRLDWYSVGARTDTLTYYIHGEENMVAFKLRFGV